MLVTWISNIGFCVPGNQQINANMVNMNFIPLEEVLKSAVWSSSSLFASHYLRDFREQTENLRAMGPIIAAQKVVGGRANLVSHEDK